MSRDVSDPNNYRIIRREDGSGKYEVQIRIDDRTWRVEREVRSATEGNEVIKELRQQEKK